MSVSEDQLAVWAKAPSETEESKCQNAVSSVTSAIRKKFGQEVEIFLQGSYKNRTNIKKDSDVDIVVLHTGYYFPSDSFLSPEDKQIYWNNFKPSVYSYENFKNELNEVLVSQFGLNAIERKDKCIRIAGNSYRVDSDVVPAFEYHRLKTHNTTGAVGIGLETDNGIIIDSYPNHHYQNGVTKNQETKEKYKSVVRILKNVRNELADKSVIKIEQMPSFLIECLAWNVYPHHHFDKYSLKDTTKSVISFVWNDMKEYEKHYKYAEVSDLKWLFRGASEHKPEQAFSFMQHAWNFIG